MTQEIQKTPSVGVVTAPNPAMVGLNFFDPSQFEILQRVCKMFASSDLVPENYRAKTTPIPANADENTITRIKEENAVAMTKAMANCMIAVDYATRLGASPFMVMQNVGIIYGRPAPASKFLIAMVNSCGKFETLQYRFTDKGNIGMIEYVDYVWNDHTRRKEPIKKTFDGSNVRNIECVAYTSKKGSDKVLESAPVSIQLAIEERWYTKENSKWQTMPRLMLQYRAASMWTNAFAPELLMGMHTKEEILDITDVEFEEIPTPTADTKAKDVKTTVGFEDAPAAPQKVDEAPQETVDTETGEIKQAPATPEPANDNPGF